MASTLDQLFPGDDPVPLDGALGTTLRDHGWPAAEATVLANLRAPGLVAGVHADFREAGARVLLSNTFGALIGAPGDHVERLAAVTAGVRIARKVAGDGARVAGALAAFDLAFQGPRLDDVVRALVGEGVDLLVFETCTRPLDAERALEAHARLAPGLPAVVCATSTAGEGPDRDRVGEVLALVRASGQAEPGLNCCRGPHDLFKLALAEPALPRWLKPSRGLPDDLVDDNVMAAFARAARLRGARFIGGCCGTDAETLLSMAAALRPAPRERGR